MATEQQILRFVGSGDVTGHLPSDGGMPTGGYYEDIATYSPLDPVSYLTSIEAVKPEDGNPNGWLAMVKHDRHWNQDMADELKKARFDYDPASEMLVAKDVDIGLETWKIARFEIFVSVLANEKHVWHDRLTWERMDPTETRSDPTETRFFWTAYTWQD